MTKTMHIYALGHKGYVELRRASKAPRVETSKAIRKGVQREWMFDGPPGRLGYATMYQKEIPTTTTFTITTWIGGRPIKTIPSKSFADRTGHAIRQGAIWEMPPEVAQRLLGGHQ